MKLHGSHKINSFDRSYSDNSFKKTSLLRTNCEWWGHHSNKGGSSLMVSICAHVPMSLRARTSVPDDRYVIKVTEKVWFWQFRDADWDSGWRADLVHGAVGLLLVTPESCKTFWIILVREHWYPALVCVCCDRRCLPLLQICGTVWLPLEIVRIVYCTQLNARWRHQWLARVVCNRIGSTRVTLII